MNLSKAYDSEISKSSLVGLKAELLKKQEEVKKIREQQQHSLKCVVKPRKNNQAELSNKGIEDRRLKDCESFDDDVDIHKKSREILEAKSILYDKLKASYLDSDSKSQYLTDFNLKHEIYEKKESACNSKEETIQESENEEGHYSDSNSDPENDWVDFVDSLGRTRRCLKKDLEEMKEKDLKLAKCLRPPTPPCVPEATPELMSWDMQREQMRKKWEEQESLLLGKKEIHYQDILFDEARPHGVGYFEFSIDEAERLKQQEALKNLRNETVEQQQAAEGLRVRRQQQLQARLAAARRRRRERLGLPPEELKLQESENLAASTVAEEVQEEEKVINIEELVKRKTSVRPWDLGKQSIDSVMSQEEWIEKKRLDRPEEFAPPKSCYIEGTHDNESYTSKNKINKLYKITKSIKNNKGKFTHNLDKLKDCINNKVSSSPLEGLKENPSQSNISTVVNISPSIKNNIIDTEGKNCKKTSDEIDAFLSRVRASCSNPAPQDNTDTSSSKNKPNVECNGSTVNISESKQKHGTELLKKTKPRIGYEEMSVSKDETSELLQYSNIDHGIGNETKFPRTFNHLRASNLIKHSNATDEVSTVAENNQLNTTKRKWAEIAPPASMSYYTNNTPNKQPFMKSNISLANSISVGLNYLKAQTEEKEKKRVKGLLDII